MVFLSFSAALTSVWEEDHPGAVVNIEQPLGGPTETRRAGS